MQIILYNVSDEPEAVPKTLASGITRTGTIRDQAVDLQHPIITVTGTLPPGSNYAHIPDFGRYYFLDPPRSVRNNLLEIQMHCDVLQSFYNQILQQRVIVDRAAGVFDAYLHDDRQRMEAYTRSISLPFKSAGLPVVLDYDISHAILITAG